MTDSGTATGKGAWVEPGAHEVAPGVHRVPLPLPHDGLRAVNVYVLTTDDGLVCIDGGWAIPASRAQFTSALAELGAGLGDVRRFLVTHAHRDHYTQAVEVRREFGAHVALGIGERPTLELLQDRDRDPFAQRRTALEVAGAGELAERLGALIGNDPAEREQWQLPDTWIEPGEVALPGGRVLEAVHTPGHTSGHLVFADDAAGLLFAGDHVLPTITPSIGFEPAMSADPLGSFLRSLAVVRSRPDAQLLPAHGPVAPSVHARVDELLEHHSTRLRQTESACAAGASSALEVAGVLRWTRREHRLADLDPFNAVLAVLEADAHLRLLLLQGRLVAEVVDGVERFSPS